MPTKVSKTAFIDMTGKRVGRWSVIRQVARTRNRRSRWLCRCACGKHKEVDGYTIRCGDSHSCGCLSAEKAKQRVGPLHQNWAGGEAERNLKKKYGIDLKEYARLLESQNGVCAICGNKETATHSKTGAVLSL